MMRRAAGHPRGITSSDANEKVSGLNLIDDLIANSPFMPIIRKPVGMSWASQQRGMTRMTWNRQGGVLVSERETNVLVPWDAASTAQSAGAHHLCIAE